MFIYGCLAWFGASVANVNVFVPAGMNDTVLFVGIPLAIGIVGAVVGRQARLLPPLLAGVLAGHLASYLLGVYLAPAAGELVEVTFYVALWSAIVAVGFMVVVAALAYIARRPTG